MSLPSTRYNINFIPFTIANEKRITTFFSSSFLYSLQTLKNDKPSTLPELLTFHGTADNVVPFDWGKTTFDTLKSAGVRGKFMKLEGADHELVKSELNFVKDWLLQLLPDNVFEKSDE